MVKGCVTHTQNTQRKHLQEVMRSTHACVVVKSLTISTLVIALNYRRSAAVAAIII